MTASQVQLAIDGAGLHAAAGQSGATLGPRLSDAAGTLGARSWAGWRLTSGAGLRIRLLLMSRLLR